MTGTTMGKGEEKIRKSDFSGEIVCGVNRKAKKKSKTNTNRSKKGGFICWKANTQDVPNEGLLSR